MKVCSLYGVGFYYIPGTDICMKLGGYVRFQQNFGSTDITGGPFAGTGALNTRVSSADQTYRARWLLQHDTRQQTAYGTLRTYMILGFSQDSGTDTTFGANTTRIYATRAFIQLAGFTFGKATSYFDFVSSAAVAYNAGATSSPDTGDGGHVVAAYTAQLGNGISGTISFEQERARGILYLGSPVLGGTTGAATNDLAGTNRLQDIVANLRVDQAWGAAQIAVAAHNSGTSYYGNGIGGAGLTNEWQGHPGDKWGWAVTAGLRLNFPMIGPGDYFQGQVVYAEGASQYASNTPGAFLVKNGSTFGVNTVNDGGFTGTATVPGIYELTTAWSVFASYEHFWTPSLRTSIYGSYVDYSRSDNLNTALCASGLVAGGTSALGRAGGCDLDSSYWVVGTRSQWNITKDLYMGFDVLYSRLNSGRLNAAGTYTAAAGNGVVAGNFYTTANQEAVSAAWRIHRDIVP